MNIDDAIQKAFTAMKNVRWRDCESDNAYEWYYAESMLYVIRQKETGAHWFIKSKSPDTALECVLNKIRK